MTGPGLDQVAEHRHAESSSSCGAQIALAVVAAVSLFAITFAAVVATSSPSPQLRALPVPRRTLLVRLRLGAIWTRAHRSRLV